MLFNTLANLRALIATDPARATAMLDRFNDYLRATLGASRQAMHPLADEFDRLRDYLELMAVRMGPRLAYTLDLPDELRAAPIPPLLLQSLVENAIVHGLEPHVAGGHITVQARRQGSLVCIEINDNGAGFDAGFNVEHDNSASYAPAPTDNGAQLASPPHSGFGIAQVRERLANTYGAEGTIKIVAAHAGGTCASVHFPMQKNTSPTPQPQHADYRPHR